MLAVRHAPHNTPPHGHTGGKLLSVGDCVAAALMLLADTTNAGKCYYLEPDSAGYWCGTRSGMRADRNGFVDAWQSQDAVTYAGIVCACAAVIHEPLVCRALL